MKLCIGLVGLLTVAALPIASVAGGSERVPRFVSYRLGGVDIWSTDKTKQDVYMLDKGSKYCLHISHAPENEIGMLLCPESELEQSGDLDLKRDASEIRYAHITPMETESGVKIGDTPQEVLRLLGTPTEYDAAYDGSPLKTGNGSLHYNDMGGHLHGWSYESWYEFNHGHLTSISITIQKGKEVAG